MKILPRGSKIILGFIDAVQEHRFRGKWFSYPCIEVYTEQDCILHDTVLLNGNEVTPDWDSYCDVGVKKYQHVRILFKSIDVINT